MLFFIYQTTQNIIASPVTGIPNHRKSASNRAGSIIYNRFVYGKSVAPRHFIICLLKSTVSMPIATYIKKAENPVA